MDLHDQPPEEVSERKSVASNPEKEPRAVRKLTSVRQPSPSDLSESQVEQKTGNELLDLVADLTGLHDPRMRKEMDEMLKNSGCSSEEATLDDLRAALLIYMESLAPPGTPTGEHS